MILPAYDEIYVILRRLAKTNYWQSLYGQIKEINGIQIFKNTTGFTQLQLYFLNQLAFYSSLYFDIATNEVSDLVLDNEIYEDAYWYYRTEERLKKTKRQLEPEKIQQGNTEQIINRNEWAFTKVKGK